MQKCEKCHSHFKWIDIYRTAWRKGENSKHIHCRECATEHTMSLESKIIRSVVHFLAIFIGLCLVEFYLAEQLPIPPFILAILVPGVLYYISYSLLPFFTTYHSKYHGNYTANF